MFSPIDASSWRLEWNDGFSVFISEIDAEHQHFIGLINELNEAIIGRMSLEKIKKCMLSILDNAAAHFAHEEALFKEWGYPGADEHVKGMCRSRRHCTRSWEVLSTAAWSTSGSIRAIPMVCRSSTRW